MYSRICAYISGALVDDETFSRTELDSHANMVVLGRHSFIFETTGRTCTVYPFTDDLGKATDIPIVDGAIAYDCPHSGITYLLLLRNVLYMPNMSHNLIPPFIMQEGGLIVNDRAKIHSSDPSEDDHCILFPNHDLRIPLKLNGIFSFFSTRKPLPTELDLCDKIFITPDLADWNPYCESFEKNESSFLNFDGSLSDSFRHTKEPMFIDHQRDLPHEVASLSLSQLNLQIDAVVSSAHTSLFHVSELDHSLADYDFEFYDALALRGEVSKLFSTLGSCNVESESSDLWCRASATSASKGSGLDPENLS